VDKPERWTKDGVPTEMFPSSDTSVRRLLTTAGRGALLPEFRENAVPQSCAELMGGAVGHRQGKR
jgi:hypothetical protein